VPRIVNTDAYLQIKGTDPVGGLGVGIIATLLSLLKKDPMSLFAPSLPIPALAKRDVPHLAERTAEFEVPELQKRQLGLPVPNTGVPSLSQGIPGIGIGSLVGSGIPGTSIQISTSLRESNETKQAFPPTSPPSSAPSARTSPSPEATGSAP
jgi:hypothetical protein